MSVKSAPISLDERPIGVFVMERVSRIAAGQLSKRQRQVLLLAAQGFDGVEIAKQLRLSSSTVRQHLCKIHERLQARNTTHAVVIALQQQLIFLEDTHVES